MNDKAVEVQHLCKSYMFGKTLVETLHDVTFSLPRFSLTSVIGHNGAGKTTLLEILAGLRKPTAGTVNVLGRAADSVDIPREGIIAYLPQHLELVDELTVIELVDHYCSLNGNRVPSGSLIDQTGLAEYTDKRYAKLSGGLKRRTAIACILAADPEMVIMDEPAAGLDPMSREDLWDLLISIRDSGKTVILTSHEVPEALVHSDYVLRMGSGRLEYFGSASCIPQRLRARIKGEYTVEGFPSTYGSGITTFLLEDYSSLSALIERLAEEGLDSKAISVDSSEVDRW